MQSAATTGLISRIRLVISMSLGGFLAGESEVEHYDKVLKGEYIAHINSPSAISGKTNVLPVRRTRYNQLR
jgi:hypothetical protein